MSPCSNSGQRAPFRDRVIFKESAELNQPLDEPKESLAIKHETNPLVNAADS